MFPHTITNESIVVVIDGKSITVQKSAPNFENLHKALTEKNWDDVRKHSTVTDSLQNWSKGFFQFNPANDTVTYKGEPVHRELTERMVTMARAGESPEPLMRFWEKLQKNPSMRSVEQLFPFLAHQGIPIQPNGNFLAYKGVKENYTDRHSGTVDNKPGVVNEMPRNKISDDPNEACHYGYHVGDLSYARSFASIVVVCEVDPQDVVCIPYDANCRKMRVCKYKVVGNHNGELLPSTTYELDQDIGIQGKISTGDKEELLPEPKQPEVLTDEEKKLIAEGKSMLALKTIKKRFDVDLKKALEMVKDYRDEPKKKKPKQRELATRRPENKKMVLVVPKKFKKLHTMGQLDLMKQPIELLRTYASQVLHMVGASKILGGKIMLVNQIMKIRSNFK